MQKPTETPLVHNFAEVNTSRKKSFQECCMSLKQLVCCGCLSKIPQTEQLTQQRFILSQCWGLEVQDQGVSRVDFFLVLSPWLAVSCLLCVTSHGHPGVCLVSVCVLHFLFLTRTPFISDRDCPKDLILS